MTEVKHDTLNVIELADLGVSMEAVADKIMILVDSYKSGYECKECGGTGRIKSSIVEGATSQCADCKGKGVTLVIPDNAKSMPSTGVIVSMGPDTKFMKIKEDLKECKSFYEPDQVKEHEDKLAQMPIQVGARVCFGVHVGTKIPLKGNIILVVMRENEPLCRIFGSDIADKELIDYNAEINF